MSGSSVSWKMLKSRKISLKSVALAVQQHKNKVLDKVGDIKKCNQQWKHPKNSDKEWKKKNKNKKKTKNPRKDNGEKLWKVLLKKKNQQQQQQNKAGVFFLEFYLMLRKFKKLVWITFY